MKRNGLLNLIAIIVLISNCVQSKELEAEGTNCPIGYELMNGLCYLKSHEKTPTKTLTMNCPIGYKLLNGLCYIDSQQHNAANCNTATTELPSTNNVENTEHSSVESLAKTTPSPIPAAKTSCPSGSTFFNGQCRIIICPSGEFIAGRCLKITCPAGMVWRENSCKEPEYLTTVLEIENVILSKTHESHGNITRTTTNKINNVTATTTISLTTTPATTTTAPTTKKPVVIVRPTLTTTQRPPAQLVRPECCIVHSPRLCKNYQRKWVCFNHRREFCDRRVCAYPTMYLKTPQTVYKESLLIMPPHPPLKACRERGCDSISTVDCSGCAKGERENCSPYCYYYYCPENTCGYMDLQDFCEIYPKHPFGCNQEEGCIWGWCGGKKNE